MISIDRKSNVYIETYGCQMNLNDTEIVSSILTANGFNLTENIDEAGIIFLNTCSVRDNAERKIKERLIHLKKNKKAYPKLLIGILGCMASRLDAQLFDNNSNVNIVAGPDEYRQLPLLITDARTGIKSSAVNLSKYETYNDIEPLRKDDLSAWISIMRGCNNFCSYCVVPLTRGRERSRPFSSIIEEVKHLANTGIKEITLLGQNVNSYIDKENEEIQFHDLLDHCAEIVPDVWFRFVTSHPKDLSDKLIDTMAKYSNICNHIHLPVQSGSDRILALMNRKYTSNDYLQKVEKLRSIIPNCSITTDIIAGFPSETIDDHKDTLDLIKQARYDGAFMFRYSPRENTKAYNFSDDVPEDEKIRRLNEIIYLQQSISVIQNNNDIGKTFELLIEGESKRNPLEWQGRTDTNKVVIFTKYDGINRGDKINVKVIKSTSATLFGEVVIPNE